MATWDSYTTAWGQANAVYSENKPVQIIGSQFYMVDDGANYQGDPVAVALSHEGLAIYGRDQRGNPKVDASVVKNLQGIWPELRGVPGTIVQVSVGFQDATNQPITWSDKRDFVLGTDFFLDFIVTGKYLAVRFESLGQLPWELSGYDLDIEVVGGK